MMNNTNAVFAILSEAWINDDNIDFISNDLKSGYNLNILSRHRRKKRGGGVALVWRGVGKLDLQFRMLPVFQGEFEILVCKTRLEEAKCMLFVFSLYYPPDMLVGAVEKMNNLLAEEIQKIKTTESDPMIIIGGDFNGKDFTSVTDEFGDIVIVDAPPTRSGRKLDACYTNVSACAADLLPPLQSRNNTLSDHHSLLFKTTIPKR